MREGRSGKEGRWADRRDKIEEKMRRQEMKRYDLKSRGGSGGETKESPCLHPCVLE